MPLHYDVAGFLRFISLFCRNKQRNGGADGLLDLSVYPSVLMSVEKIKLSVTMDHGFQLINKITLKIKDVHLLANYTITGAKDNDGAANFGSHIKIEFLLENYSNGEVKGWLHY